MVQGRRQARPMGGGMAPPERDQVQKAEIIGESSPPPQPACTLGDDRSPTLPAQGHAAPSCPRRAQAARGPVCETAMDEAASLPAQGPTYQAAVRRIGGESHQSTHERTHERDTINYRCERVHERTHERDKITYRGIVRTHTSVHGHGEGR